MPKDYKGPAEAPNYSKEVDGGFFIVIYPPYKDPYFEEDSWDGFVVEIQNDDLGIFPDEDDGTYAFFKSFNAADSYGNKKVAELRKEFGLAENYKMKSLYNSQKHLHVSDTRTKHESYKSRRRLESMKFRRNNKNMFEATSAKKWCYHVFDAVTVDDNGIEATPAQMKKEMKEYFGPNCTIKNYIHSNGNGNAEFDVYSSDLQGLFKKACNWDEDVDMVIEDIAMVNDIDEEELVELLEFDY